MSENPDIVQRFLRRGEEEEHKKKPNFPQNSEIGILTLANPNLIL